jgi:RimJ/RimL family protein N-acetyltransferase
MKITKQRLKEIIREELEFVGAEIEDAPEPPEDVEEPDLGLGTPEETLLTLMRAREILDQFGSFEELAAAYPDIEQDQDTARWVAAIKANPMYGSSGVEEGKGPRFTSTGPWAPEYRDK